VSRTLRAFDEDTTMQWCVTSVPAAIAREVRSSGRSPQYGHPAHAEIASGYGPCRCCLQPFVAGRDRRLLFTFNPFDDGVPSPGPVFIHADACTPHSGTGFPPGLRGLPLLFEAHDGTGLPRARLRPTRDGPEAAIEALFAERAVARIVVRHAEARVLHRAHRARRPRRLKRIHLAEWPGAPDALVWAP
jgi:hypothetical protein